MGVNGCGEVQEACKDTKTMYVETKMVVQTQIWALWPGKFPRTSCFEQNKQKGHGRLRMGAHGFTWVQWSVFARGDWKTRGDEAKIGGHCMFYRCEHGQEKQHVVYTWKLRLNTGKNRCEWVWMG